MGWLDNIIGWISPEWGARREVWRQYMNEVRHYDAGDYSRLNSGWYASNQSAEVTDRYSRDTVRARARDLERNSDMMNSVVGPFVRNTVGSGYVLQSYMDDQDTAREIERLWKLWCKKQNCDVTGTQSFNQMLRMAVRRKKVDGGILFVKRYTDAGMVPFQLQIFEVDELDCNQLNTKEKGNRIVGGIEYNQYNRPVGYWFRQYALDGITMMEPIYVPAKDVIFYFSKRRPSQLREISDMSQTITRIRDANEFMTAVSVKQRIEACLSVFIKKSLPTAGLGRSQNAATGPRTSYDGKTLTPGMIRELNAGDDVYAVNPQGQATDASSFIKLFQRLFGAGQGLSYEATSRDMSQSNYSSTRQGLIEDGMTYVEDEELLLEVMDEIYETFVISVVLAGLIKAPGFWSDKQKFFQHKWVKDPKPWIDPAKEATATKIALQTGQKTFKQIAAENGTDWKTQVDDIAEVLQYAKEEHGIDLGGVILGQAVQQQTAPAQQTETPAAGSGADSSTPEKRSNTQHRELFSGAIRAMDGEGNERKFTLSFSSEEPYERWWGNEILDHASGAVDLARLNEIGVVLFNHNRDSVIGRIIRAWLGDDHRCYAEIEFDTDEQSEIIYQKVRSGTLKGVSVGYRIDTIEEVLAGKTTADGRFTGPAEVVRKWWPYEVSIVSIPADSTVGVGRQVEEIGPGTPLDILERQLQINKNSI